MIVCASSLYRYMGRTRIHRMDLFFLDVQYEKNYFRFTSYFPLL